MTIASHTNPVDEDIEDRIEEMIHDLGQEGFRQAHAPLYEQLQVDSKKPLYLGCTSFTWLSVMLDLVNLKARLSWSDKSFTELLVVLKKMLPENNTLLKNQYEAKKILSPMGMKYQKIHACPNDCILYKNQFSDMRKCPTCGVSRYKAKDDEGSHHATTNNDRPTKVYWYLPIIPRFNQLYANAHDAENLTWYADGRKSDGLLWYPADSPQWKTVDRLFPDFGDDPRNSRLRLASDEMNPFGNLSTNHSSWSVLLMIYNLPPWL